MIKRGRMTIRHKGGILLSLVAFALVILALWLWVFVQNQTNNIAPAQTATVSNSDAGLSSDLQNIKSSLSQSNHNLQNVDKTINDKQLPITE